MIKLPEPVAHIYPSTLEKFAEPETFGHCFSIKVGCPDETSVELVTLESAKQAVRDALEEAAKECEWLAVNVVPHGDAYVAKNCGKRIRALIKEIPA